jgi:hypothetical protein
MEKGNTVGSGHVMLTSNEEAYILGLWCADGYHRTSSFGLSSINVQLIKRFAKYLLSQFKHERLRLRIYIPAHHNICPPSLISEICDKISYLRMTKARNVAYQVYVNSRPLLRRFMELKTRISDISDEEVIPYIAGRFDGDGSVAEDLRRDLRIVYGNKEEALRDKNLLNKIRGYRIQIYCYRKARTYCLYVSRYDAKGFIEDIKPFSSIIASPRRD